MVTLYSKDACPQCNFTKMILNSKNVTFEEINIDRDQEAKDYLVSNGFMSLPVVTRDGHEPISGNNPGKLNEMITDLI